MRAAFPAAAPAARRRLPRAAASRSKALARALLPAAAAWYACGLAREAFVCAPGSGAASSRGLAAGRLRGAGPGGARTQRGFFGGLFEKDDRTPEEKEQAELEEWLYPPDKMWQVSDDGERLRENYPGARDFIGLFWAVVQPAVSLGFFIVGISTYVGNIVEWTPFTAKYFYFLTPIEGMYWWPQGVAMSIYGFGGFFLFGPLQWFLQATDQGAGFCEFDKQSKRMVIVRNDVLLKDMSFDDIGTVKLEWTDMAIGDREVSVTDTEGNKISIMNADDIKALPKRILEKRAAILSDFLGKELEVEEGMF